MAPKTALDRATLKFTTELITVDPENTFLIFFRIVPEMVRVEPKILRVFLRTTPAEVRVATRRLRMALRIVPEAVMVAT
jgi:hypothetical protein